MVPGVMKTVFALFLIVGVPILSWHSSRPAKFQGVPKTALYFSAVLSQWILAGTGVLVVAFAWPSWAEAGFQPLPVAIFLGWTLVLASISILGLGIVLVLERYGWWPMESKLVYMLMPRTGREKVWALLGLAPTAGFCEEFLYRGFLLSETSGWFHSLAWGVLVSSVAFGLAHTYQGLNGVFRASLLGVLLALPVVQLGSLYPSMTAHFLIDAVALLWLGTKLLPEQPES